VGDVLAAMMPLLKSLLPLFVALPLGLAFLAPLLGRIKKLEPVCDILAVVVSGVLFLGALSLALNSTGVFVYWVGGWQPPVTGINLVADGLSQLLLVIVNLVAFIAIVFSVDYMKRFTGKDLYYCLVFLMLAGMNGVVLTGDMFNLYVFLEVASVASYALVAFGTEQDELEASFKYLVLGAIASVLILFGIGIFYNLTGTLNMAQIAEGIEKMGGPAKSPAALLAACLFLAGFGLKAGLVPFHAWLPDAHPSAPAPVSALLSGVFIKAIGIYALCRIFFNVLGATETSGMVLIVIGSASMLVGGLMAIGQWDIKRLLAFSTVSQMGYVAAAMGTAAVLLARDPSYNLAVASLCLFGGLFHLLNHAVFKSLLFLCSGAIEYAAGTRDLREMRGLRQAMPVTSACCHIGAFSIIGMPPFNGFWSKLIIIIGLIMAGQYIVAAIAVVVSFITLTYFAKMLRHAFGGSAHEARGEVKEVPALMCTAMVILAVLCLALALLPLFQGYLLEPARDVLAGGITYIGNVLQAVGG